MLTHLSLAAALTLGIYDVLLVAELEVGRVLRCGNAGSRCSHSHLGGTYLEVCTGPFSRLGLRNLKP